MNILVRDIVRDSVSLKALVNKNITIVGTESVGRIEGKSHKTLWNDPWEVSK